MTNRDLKVDWFKDWFDSPFYHILYQHRNEEEAENFIRHLLLFLQTNPRQKVLDLACGKGRHAYFLSKSGLDVYGADLAEKSIRDASKMESENLHFFVHDMRHALPVTEFDFIFNLFTSFGYFDHERENSLVLDSVCQGLKKNGILVIDFMNVGKVLRGLVAEEEKICPETTFHITRWQDGQHIYKKICFFNPTSGVEEIHVEKVQILTRHGFELLLAKAGFVIEKLFGSYTLENFDETHSDRLIIIARKK